MNKLIILVLLGFFMLDCNSGSQTNQDVTVVNLITDTAVKDNSTAEQEYISALEKWIQQDIKDYYLKIEYGAFSPMQGTWEIEVRNGSLSSWKFNNTENSPSHRDAALKMTMGPLFELAEQSFMNKEDGMFLFYAEYDAKYGYVKSVGKLANPGSSRTPPTDQTFRFSVMEFNILN